MTISSGIIFMLLGVNIKSVLCKNIFEISTEVAINRSEEYQLVFAHVIYRHGNRNIFEPFPKDQYKNESYWPGGFGALTKVGKQEQYELGKYLRRRYQNLIGSQYSSDDVYIRSSDTDRSLQSAAANAAGMFPPTGDEVWNKDLFWQPIPVHSSIPFSDDYLLNTDAFCPRYDQLFREFTKSTEFKYEMKKNAELIEYLRMNTGETLSNFIEVMWLVTLLQEEEEKGFALPNWINDLPRYTNDSLKQIFAYHMEAYTHTNELKKYRAGFLIKEMLNRFKNKSQSLLQPDRSLWIYSAHDTIIVNVLNALNLYELHVPPFSSSIFFELYHKNDNYFVKILYRKTPTDDVPALNIPNCGTMCPLDKFYELYKHILPADFESFTSLCRLST